MMPHSVNNNALMQLELPGMRTEWAELWYICGSCKGGNRIKSSMRENWFLVMFHFQTMCCCIGGTSRGSGGIWRCFAAAVQSMFGGSDLGVLDISCRRTEMCDYGLLVLSRYVEQCEGRHTPISVLSEENRVEVFQILTPARCDDVSRLSQLNICAKHLKLTNEVLKSLKKKVKCQLEVCDKKKDRSVTAQQSWAIFQKTHTHVLPGSPICWAHRHEVNRPPERGEGGGGSPGRTSLA